MVGERYGDKKGRDAVCTKPGWGGNAEAHESEYCGLCSGGGVSGCIIGSNFLIKLLSAN